MVAFRIQNTKKVLIVLLQVFFIIILSSQKGYGKDEISNYLKIKAAVDKDTIIHGDKLCLNVEFLNYTDSIVCFYPEAQAYIIKDFTAFGINNSLTINDTINLSCLLELNADSCYSKKYLINTNHFFSKGKNEIKFLYRCNLSPKVKENIKGKTGRLLSEKISVFVK